MMKKMILFFILVLGFSVLNGQDCLLKNSPFHFADGTFNISIEKELQSDKSVNFSGGLHLVEDGWNYDKEQGLTAEVQFRKYVMNFKDSESNLNGVYIAPFGRLSYFKMHHNYTEWFSAFDSSGLVSASWSENRDKSDGLQGIGLTQVFCQKLVLILV